MTAANDSAFRGLKILVVDDDDSTCDLLSVFLALYGMSVHTAKSVDQGLSLFNAINPDLLISDISMPRQSGHDLIRQIRVIEAGKAQQTPAIAITAFVGEQVKQASLEAGFQKHFTKPLNLDVLLVEVLSLLTAYSRSDTINADQ